MVQIQITPDSMKMAVEIAKAGMSSPSGSMINFPDQVAKFLEVVATKIETLRNPTS
jgi:hypothetical protein